MDLADLEAALLRGLSESRIQEVGKYEAPRQHLPAVTLTEFAGIGLDTNVLKQFRREPLLADTLSTRLAEAEVSLIIPGQCVIEFWNNHQAFAKDDLKKVAGELGKLRKALEGVRALAVAEDRLDHVQAVIDELARDLDESTAPNFLNNSRSVMDTILSSAVQPMVSRSKFSVVASVRQRSKMPPGFADEAGKGAAAFGDFFAWCDFLLGACRVAIEGKGRSEFMFVTDEQKPDWKTGGIGHPGLLDEFKRVTSGDLRISSMSELRALIT